jgi:hypothetical protein
MEAGRCARLFAQNSVAMGISQAGKQGWGYVLQWSNDASVVKAGFTTASFHSFLSGFARYNACKLVVVKAWETTKDDYDPVEDRLKPFMASNGGGWLKVTPGLKRIIREHLPCDSLKAKSQFKRQCGERILWMPWLHPSQEFVPPYSPSIATKQRSQRGAQSIIRSSGF